MWWFGPHTDMESGSVSFFDPVTMDMFGVGSLSSAPLVPVSLSTDAIFGMIGFSTFIPLGGVVNYGLTVTSSLVPLSTDSLFAFSDPVLSDLSVTAMVSAVLSTSPVVSTVPIEVLQLLVLVRAQVPGQIGAMSAVYVDSASFDGRSLPAASTSR